PAFPTLSLHDALPISLHDEDATPFERARTELCFGERLRRARRRREARVPLRAALATFERLGAHPWAARARAELRATGETVRSAEDRKSTRLNSSHVAI